MKSNEYKKEKIYNLIFGKNFSTNIIKTLSPEKFSIFEYKFIKINSFSEIIQKRFNTNDNFCFDTDEDFFNNCINNPDFAEEILSKVQKEYNSTEFIPKNNCENKKEYNTLLNTYNIVSPNEHYNSVVHRDGELLDDILVLLGIFSGEQVIRENNLNRYHQKNEMFILEKDYQKIVNQIKNIINKFRNKTFTFRNHGKLLFYYLEMNAVNTVDMKLLILSTTFDYFSKIYYMNYTNKFNNLMDNIKGWECVGNTNDIFENRLYFLITELLLKDLDVKSEKIVFKRMQQFIYLRNKIVHSGRIFPIEKRNDSEYQLDSQLCSRDKKRYTKFFGFVEDGFTYKEYISEMIEIINSWQKIFIFCILNHLEVSDWYYKGNFIDEISWFLNDK
ncbi:hypothetical protein C7954_1525 [Halanaerobium congolense]|jgi:hypothetical protein|uniref:Uncharacterized protein n=1 Tax=Halanaerobium congolense TaxID=54121 RepID=A0A4R8GAU4_9FIRM|nr:hypothetical protein [Halanaerobium congolense]TDX36001.1 hypothetical protein C7954_1525 [Halanaerobium congolense]